MPNKKIVILAIESSCDEFSVAISFNGKIITNIVSSQINDHKKFGGVVPELASRLHVKNFPYVLDLALKKAKISINEVTHISYTENPGLIGSLIVGSIVAKTLAMYLGVPLIPLNHIQGHIYGAQIDKKFNFPVLCLVVSGGHTQIVYLKKNMDFQVLASTGDDAIGECYDKVARVLGLSYPGGPKIDNLANMATKKTFYKFPSVNMDNSFNFSFSGLKTAAINLIHNLNQKKQSIEIENFCYFFQKAAIDGLLQSLEKAINNFKVQSLAIAGGVSANSYLRSEITKLANKYNLEINIPSVQYCTDNAAMIAELCFYSLKK